MMRFKNSYRSQRQRPQKISRLKQLRKKHQNKSKKKKEMQQSQQSFLSRKMKKKKSKRKKFLFSSEREKSMRNFIGLFISYAEFCTLQSGFTLLQQFSFSVSMRFHSLLKLILAVQALKDNLHIVRLVVLLHDDLNLANLF